jgi:hypothetical protein
MYRIFIEDPIWFDEKQDSAPVNDIVIDRANLDLASIDMDDDPDWK